MQLSVYHNQYKIMKKMEDSTCWQFRLHYSLHIDTGIEIWERYTYCF